MQHLLLGGIVNVLYCKKNVACSKSSAQIREMEMQSSFKSLINAKTAEIIQRISQTAFKKFQKFHSYFTLFDDKLNTTTMLYTKKVEIRKRSR